MGNIKCSSHLEDRKTRLPSTETREAQLDLDERHINFAEGPDNGPALLLIHGISGRWQDWDSIFDLLASNWHIYAVDLRGHGKSSWVAKGYHWRNYSLDQIALIEQVIGEPSFVIGHSLGGSTALGLCAERPDLVRAAVYEDPPLFVHRRWEGNQFRNSFTAILEVLERKPTVAELVEALKETQPENRDDEYFENRAQKLLAMDPEVFISTISGRSRVNWRSEDLLAKATSPVLLLQAEPELGAALWDDEAEDAMSLLPNAEFEKWEDSGHGMHSQFPYRFTERVVRFFNTHI